MLLWLSIDPLSEKYGYNSTYAFQENKMGIGRELEGLEVEIFFENTSLSPSVEVLTKIGETTGEFSESQLANFSRGRATEAEQLLKNGLEKNTKPEQAIDPKTGREGTTIPDSYGKSGETVEIKDVKYQPETSQLRLQRTISNNKDLIPRLIINQSAKLSKNITNGNYNIQRYSPVPINIIPTVVKESTNVPKPIIPNPGPSIIPKPKPKPKPYDPLSA